MRTLLVIAFLCGCGGTGQSGDCQKWIECWEALPGSTPGGQDEAYGPNGACWQSTPANAAACTSSCKNATAAQAQMTNAPAACK